MSLTRPRALIEVEYEREAQAYLRRLPPEHFMEAVPQATQRRVTTSSLEVVHAIRPDIQCFNELLVQYPAQDDGRKRRRPRQVVPDNMISVWPEPLRAETSFIVPIQPVGPFVVLEYVSKHSTRKDYVDSMEKYEKELKVPYYLIHYPDNQELTLYHHTGERYVTVIPNEQGRVAIPELEMEIGLIDGWARFWFRGDLVPIPTELHHELNETRAQLETERRRADDATQRAEEAIRRADDAVQRADEASRHAEREKEARIAIEQELAQIREELRRRGG